MFEFTANIGYIWVLFVLLAARFWDWPADSESRLRDLWIYVFCCCLRNHFFEEKSGKRTFICSSWFIASVWMSFQCNRWISRAKPKHIHIFYCIRFCYTNVNIRLRHSIHHSVESSIFPTNRRWRNLVEQHRKLFIRGIKCFYQALQMWPKETNSILDINRKWLFYENVNSFRSHLTISNTNSIK